MNRMQFCGADGIRGLACAIVLVLHAVALFFPALLPKFVGVPKEGVWLFFVLSAFLLTIKLDRAGLSVGSLSGYFAGRFFRIVPLFFIALVMYMALNAGGLSTWGDVKDALFFERGFAHFWTIPVEFKVYFILPVIVFFLREVKRVAGGLGVIFWGVAAIAASQLVWPYWETPNSSIETRWYIGCFILGSVSALVYEDVRRFNSKAISDFIALVVLFVMVVSAPGVREWIFGVPLDAALLNKFLYLSFAWSVFVLFVVEGGGLAWRFVMWRPLRMLGKISFSVYLFHWLVLELLANEHSGSVAWLAISILLSLVFGALIYWSVEIPIERFRHRVVSSGWGVGRSIRRALGV